MSGETTANVWEMSDQRTPWCIHVAATLRIADHMAAGKVEIGDLAAAASCDQDALHAVLGHLAGRGVFIQTAPGRFELNEAARQLLDPLTRRSLDLEDIGGRFAHAWGTLLAFVRTGEPAYQQVFGRPFWEDLEAHPDLAASLDEIIGPPGHGTPNPDFKISGGWDAVQTIADIGGGTGAMLAEVLKRHPNLHGILVDQPGTVARSAGIFEAAGVTERVKAIGQSFFDPLPAGADLYLLRGIINDWPDREAAAILRRCAEAARPHGRVVVLKSAGPDNAPRDLVIEMVLLGGKQRGITAFQALAQSAGLSVAAAGPQPSGYFVVECRPA